LLNRDFSPAALSCVSRRIGCLRGGKRDGSPSLKTCHDATNPLRPDEQGPSGTAGLCLGASHELGAPCGDVAEIALQRRSEIASGVA